MRVVVVGDGHGVPQTLRALGDIAVVGVVAAANRPQYHDELAAIAATIGAPLLVQPLWQHDGYDAFVEALAELDADLVVCNSYSMLLRDDVLALPRLGGVNLHAAKLPEYRGPNPLQWAIIEDARITAVTLHWLTAEFDAGDVIASRPVPIRLEDSWRDVWTRLDRAADELLAAELPRVLAGTSARARQDDTHAVSRRRRTHDDGRIDWKLTVLEVYNLVRALGDGLPPAFYDVDGERIEVDGRRPLAEIASLVFAPGPGGRRLEQAGVTATPVAGDELTFAISGGLATRGRLLLDLERRQAAIDTDAPDATAAALLESFARDELGFDVS